MRFRYLDFDKLEYDPPFSGVMMAYWYIVECNIPVVIACIPTIKPLVARMYPRLLESAPPAELHDLSDQYQKPPTISSTPSRGEISGSE
jgi:hypothetical protein